MVVLPLRLLEMILESMGMFPPNACNRDHQDMPVVNHPNSSIHIMIHKTHNGEVEGLSYPDKPTRTLQSLD